MNVLFLTNFSLNLAEVAAEQDGAELAAIGEMLQKQVAASFDKTWNNILLGDLGSTSSLYGALAHVGIAVAVVSILFWVVQWAKSMLYGDNPEVHLEQLIWPLLVVALLSSNGKLLAHSTIGMRDIINSVNATVLKTTSDGLALDAAFSKATQSMADQSLGDAIASACALHRGDPEQYHNCMEARRTEAKDNKAKEDDKQWWEQLGGYVSDSLQASVTALVQVIFAGLGLAYQWAVELMLLLTALLGPLAVGATLLPISGAQKPLIGWFISFMSVGLAKLCFNIIVGLAATIVADTNQGDVISMVFSLLIGIFAPLLSTILAAGAGKMGMEAIASKAQAMAGKAIGVAFGAATGGAGAPAAAAAPTAGGSAAPATGGGSGSIAKARLQRSARSIDQARLRRSR